MQGRLRTLENPHLSRAGCIWCYGHFGPPVLVLPSASGMAHEWQSNSMIETHASLLAAGRMKLYCVESNVSESWTDKERRLDERMRHHKAYERFILDTVVSFIHEDCRSNTVPITIVGISVGAFLAVNFALKFPEIFQHAIGFSGRYDASYFTDGESNQEVYFNNPLAYVRGLEDRALEHVRGHTRITLVCGQGNWEDGNIDETILLGRLLDAQGIDCVTDIWGTDSHHQWPYWKKQTSRHFAREFGG